MKTASLRSFLHPEMIVQTSVLFLVEFARGAALISFLPLYGRNALGLDLDVIGVAITAHYVTDTFVKLAIGWLMNHLTVRTLVNGSLLASLAGIFLTGYADVPWLFIVSAALFGIGISPIWIVCLTHIQEERRATQMGFLYTIWLVGIGTGPVVTNVLMEAGGTLAYWVMLLIVLAAWLLSWLIPPGRTAVLKVVPFREQLALLGERLKEMKALLPGMVVQTLAAGMLVPILPSFASDHLGLTPTQYSILLFVGGGCTVAGLIPMGRLSDAWGKKWFLVCGFLIFGVALYALTRQPGLALSLMWALVLGLSYAAVLPAWNALLASYVPPGQSGLGWGVFSTVEGIGGMIGPGIGGLIAAATGEPAVVGIAAACFIVISLFYWLFPFRLFRGENPVRIS